MDEALSRYRALAASAVAELPPASVNVKWVAMMAGGGSIVLALAAVGIHYMGEKRRQHLVSTLKALALGLGVAALFAVPLAAAYAAVVINHKLALGAAHASAMATVAAENVPAAVDAIGGMFQAAGRVQNMMSGAGAAANAMRQIV